jgi:hypothetical protein
MSVFANGLEVSGKATPNKTIAAFPDVCMSPPPPPAGPVPIPYPLTSMASDTTDGCTSVFVKGKEAGKKNATKYSKSTGDEPATNNFGAGLITHKITGPLRFAAYSFDVIFEGGGATRFTDLTTQNHMNGGDGSVGASAASQNVTPPAPPPDCATLRAEATRMRTASNQQSWAELRNFGNRRAEQNMGTRAYGALTATQSAGSDMARRTSNALNADACNQRGLPVAPKTGLNSTSSNVCGGGKPYKDMEKKNHTEAQMLENVDWDNPPQWVAFATDWPGYDRATGRPDPKLANGPCPDCQEKLDEACECGLKIILCDSTGNPRDYCNS